MQQFQLRILDFVLALAGIVLTLPLMLLIFVTVLLTEGSPLFVQRRVGRNRQLFKLVKFRTMRAQTRSVGTHLVDATSITRIGRFLRKSKLDELPQLFNVLLGQMSLVGPRPCLPNQSGGLAQVNHVDMSTPRKLARYDQLMINHMSVALYFKLLLATAVGRGYGDRVRTAGN